MIHLKKENLEDLIKEGKCLIDFYATWCGPCRMLAPVLEELDDEINIIKVDVDEHPELTQKYGVMSIPTLVFLNNGEEKEQVVGFRDKDELKGIIDNLQ